MSELEELVRSALASDAESQFTPTNLVGSAIQRGRRLKRVRRASAGAFASAVAVSAVILAVNVVSPSSRTVPAAGNPGNIGVTASTPPPPSRPPSPSDASAPPDVSQTPPDWNHNWPTGRAFGSAAGPALLARVAPGEPLTVYASGHAPDGSTFVMYTMADRPSEAQWQQGFDSTTPDFGDNGAFSCDGQCNVFQYPTVETHAGKATTQWLVAATAPDVIGVSYSSDGQAWQPMLFADGIALLQLPGISPRSAEIRVLLSAGPSVATALYPTNQTAEGAASSSADTSAGSSVGTRAGSSADASGG